MSVELLSRRRVCSKIDRLFEISLSLSLLIAAGWSRQRCHKTSGIGGLGGLGNAAGQGNAISISTHRGVLFKESPSGRGAAKLPKEPLLPRAQHPANDRTTCWNLIAQETTSMTSMTWPPSPTWRAMSRPSAVWTFHQCACTWTDKVARHKAILQPNNSAERGAFCLANPKKQVVCSTSVKMEDVILATTPQWNGLGLPLFPL